MPDRIRRALDGDRAAVRALVDEVAPVIQARAVRALVRRQEAAGRRDVRQEAGDLVQHVFSVLFAEQGKILLQWDPARGASLANFVGLVAEREIASILRRRRRSPWGDHPTEEADLDRLVGAASGPEDQVVSRDLLQRVVARARERLSDRGLELFQWIVIDGRPVEEVVELAGMTPDAVYAWRSRLAKLLREIAAEGLSDREGPRRKPLGTGTHDG